MHLNLFYIYIVYGHLILDSLFYTTYIFQISCRLFSEFYANACENDYGCASMYEYKVLKNHQLSGPQEIQPLPMKSVRYLHGKTHLSSMFDKTMTASSISEMLSSLPEDNSIKIMRKVTEKVNMSSWIQRQYSPDPKTCHFWKLVYGWQITTLVRS